MYNGVCEYALAFPLGDVRQVWSTGHRKVAGVLERVGVGRVAIFIDGAYLDATLRDDFQSARVNYAQLSEALAGEKEILRTYYYHCLPYQSNPPTTEESDRFGKMQAFFHALRQIPRYEVREGRLQFRGVRDDGTPILQQKRVDVMLAVDLTMLSAKQQISDAILITGDSDFIPPVNVARNEGVVVWLYHGTNNPPHADLWELADERVRLTQALIDSVRRAPS